jgi:hypothetical protein
VNEEALAHLGLLRQKQTKNYFNGVTAFDLNTITPA